MAPPEAGMYIDEEGLVQPFLLWENPETARARSYLKQINQVVVEEEQNTTVLTFSAASSCYDSDKGNSQTLGRCWGTDKLEWGAR